MIIMETPARPPGAPTEEDLRFLGEVEELGQITSAFLCEVHNLTLATARAEFAAARAAPLREYEGAGRTGEDAGRQGQAGGAWEFVKRMVEIVVEHLIKIKDWIVAAVKSIAERVFGPRRAWLAKNKGEILRKTNYKSASGPLTVNIGSQLRTGRLDGMLAKFERVAGRMADEVRAVHGLPKWEAPLERIYNDWLRMSTSGESIHARLLRTYIGAVMPHEMDPGLARDLVGVGEATFENMYEMKGVTATCDKLIAEARADARDGDPKEKSNRLRAISWVSGLISRTLSSAAAVNSMANSQAIGALHRALHFRPEAA